MVAGHLLASGLPAEHGYVLAFVLSFGFLAVCVLASLLVPGRRAGTSADSLAQPQLDPASAG